MANFNTHLIVASTISGLAATGALNAGVIETGQVLPCFAAGTLGGLLPDLDSDNSSLLKLIFGVIAVISSFLVMLNQMGKLNAVLLIAVWSGCFLFVYFGVFTFFKKMTVHRGIFHSIPAGMFFAGLITTISYYYLDLKEFFAWMIGAFVLLGYIVHLVLDEIYSVDMANVRIKRSFGTALKIIDRKNMAGTIIAYLGAIIFLFSTPGFQNFIGTVFKKSVYVKFQKNLFPEGKWFSKAKEE